MSSPPRHAKPIHEAFPNPAERYVENVKRLCSQGAWIGWGRQWDISAGRPWDYEAAWTEIPASAWGLASFGHDGEGHYSLWRQEWRKEPIRKRHPLFNHAKWYDYEERLVTVEKWTDLCFAPAGIDLPVAAPRRFSPSDVEKFVLEEYLPALGRLPKIGELVEAVRGRYPDVPRDFVRKLKALHAPGRPGRRKANLAGN